MPRMSSRLWLLVLSHWLFIWAMTTVGAMAADGWVVGSGATAVKSTDGGATWSGTGCPGPSCPTGVDLNSVFFVDAKSGWAVGNGATIIKTTTGGASWIPSNCPGAACPTNASLRSVYFVNGTTGWAVGSGATILKTTNGGTTWVATSCPGPSCPTGANLNSVFFIDSNTGWAVGLGPTIMKTTTGGSSWIIAGCPGPSCPTNAPLSSVYFASSATGWAVGTGATVLKTTTGGSSWLISGCPGASCPTGADLKSVFFISASTGWASGLGATIIKTTTGGTSWSPTNCPGASCPTGASMNSVFFLDSQVGWAAGSGSTILRTTNGGTTWLSTSCPGPSCPTGSTFNSVRFVNCADADGDGYYAPANCGTTLDCNDSNASIHPGATETCNSVDDNCNGSVDEGITTTYYRDADADGYGNPNNTTQACSRPTGYVTNNTDCNDSSASIHPGATETCNGVDDNCNGSIDEGVKSTFYRDADGDGYGNPSITTLACTVPAGYVATNTDCNDSNSAIHPGATEVCNGLDDNCNGSIDEGVKSTFYRDADGDGYGDLNSTTQACTAPAGYVADHTDCDDSVDSCTTDCADHNGNALADCAEIPRRPANLRVVSPVNSTSSGALGLAWDPSEFAIGYKLEYGRSSGVPEHELTINNATSATITGLTDCTNWYFVVRAFSAMGESSASEEVGSWPQPFIQSLDPVSIRQGETRAVSIQGANFPPGSTVAIPGSNVFLERVQVVSCGQIDADFVAPPSAGDPRPALVGIHGIRVATPDGLEGEKVSALTVEIDPYRFDVNRSSPTTVDRIDGMDLVWLARQFGTYYSSPNFESAYDFDGDGWVDGQDLAFIGANFARCWTGAAWTVAACP